MWDFGAFVMAMIATCLLHDLIKKGMEYRMNWEIQHHKDVADKWRVIAEAEKGKTAALCLQNQSQEESLSFYRMLKDEKK